MLDKQAQRRGKEDGHVVLAVKIVMDCQFILSLSIGIYLAVYLIFSNWRFDFLIKFFWK